MADIKLIAKTLAYCSGALGAFHRFRNRSKLTVVMFHRVLPRTDSRYPGADPEWTMTEESFTACLNFFQKHYHVVSPDQVFCALRGETRLPSRSLLITFDDGWADTAEYAQPILDHFSMRALVFIAGCAINQKAPFWEEHIYSLLTTHPEGFAKLQDILQEKALPTLIAPLPHNSEANIKQVISQLGQLDRAVLLEIAGALDQSAESRPAMLDMEQLARLVRAGHVVGGHGMTHQPLTRVKDLDHELQNAQGVMAAYLGKHSIESMSFPHGAYSDTVILNCKSVGYKYLFSSDAHLNAADGAPDLGKPVGRIHLSERALKDSAGRFQPALLATWLFLRPFSPPHHMKGATK